MADSIQYLLEFRKRLLRSVLVVVVIFIPLAYFANALFAFVAVPLLAQLPQMHGLIAIGIATPFLVPLKFALCLAVAISAPFLLQQLWAFVAPALYRHERRLYRGLLLSSVLLFYLGVTFAYVVVLPLVFQFFIHVAPAAVKVTPDINHYLSFVLKLLFAFGMAFEVPIATLMVIKAGILSRQQLARQRPIVIVGAFVLAMLLTPPDVISQVLLAVPIWLLYELGLGLARLLQRPIAGREGSAAE